MDVQPIKYNYIYALRIWCCLALLSTTLTVLPAQDTLFYKEHLTPDSTPVIRSIASYTAGRVTLRWAPGDPSTWMRLQDRGYRVRRVQLDKEGLPVPESSHEFSVTQWELEAFRPWMERENDYVLAAAQCLYGASEAGAQASFNLLGRHQEFQNRFGIALLSADLDTIAADALGLRMVDTHVDPGQLYLYQVYPADTSLRIMHGPVTIITQQIPEVQPVIDHVVEEEGHILLKWSRSAHEEIFSAYLLEVSLDDQQYTPLTTLPYVGGESKEFPGEFFSYRHLIANYQSQYYRIRGVTPFGKVSPPSAAVRAQARDKTPPGLPGKVQLHCDPMTETVTLKWQNPGDKDFHGTHIFRSFRYDGVYDPVTSSILPIHVNQYQDKALSARAITYYKVATVDTAGNMAYTRIFQAAFRDTIPPATPTGLKGSIDSTGIVMLEWDYGTEPDLAGYYVYKANQEDHFFTSVTPQPVTLNRWQDTITLKTLTEEIYYRVAAVDFHSHTSPWTTPLKIQKPDTIPPLPPSFTGYRVEKDHIELRFIPGRSKDIESHTLLRRQVPSSTWSEIHFMRIESGIWKDYDVQPGEIYEYKLITTDDAGLICSEPALLRIKCIDRSKPEVPGLLNCRKEEGGIRLEWEQPDDRTHQIWVYRSVNGGAYTTSAQLRSVLFYFDTDIQKDKTYAYKIKTGWLDGQKSGFSESMSPERH